MKSCSNAFKQFVKRLFTLKGVLAFMYILLILVMAGGTIVEKFMGTAVAGSCIYGTPEFTLLWSLLVAVGIVYIVRRWLRRWNIVLLHLSFLVILAGALLTHLTSFCGNLHLREGEEWAELDQVDDYGMVRQTKQLPFRLKLDKCTVVYHEGTQAAANYLSDLTVKDEKGTKRFIVSMNHILNYRSVRIYQTSFDSDGNGCLFTVSSDPLGIPVTYTGYALLFFSLIWLLVDSRGMFRRSLKALKGASGAALLLFLFFFPTVSPAATTFPYRTAEHFGEMFVSYNDRVTQVQTLARDFTLKIYGSSSYHGYSPEQVLCGFFFWGDEWKQEKIIKVKDGELKRSMHLADYVSPQEIFFGKDLTLVKYMDEYNSGQQDKIHKQAFELYEKCLLVYDVCEGNLLTVFPQKIGQRIYWAPPYECQWALDSKAEYAFCSQILVNLRHCALSGNNPGVNKTLDRFIGYQQKVGHDCLPTSMQIKAERIYNRVPFATLLFMLNLVLGFIALFYALWRLTKGRDIQREILLLLFFAEVVSFLTLSFCLSLRWIVSGNVPLANGYETMLSVAWLVQLLALVSWRKAPIVLVFGFLLSGFFLLVSHISQMDPAIAQLMPVLNSPLLSIHVSVIMMSYALLSLTFICGIMALLVDFAGKVGGSKKAVPANENPAIRNLQTLSRIFFYPSLTTLGLGIFIGAIWANVSWGTYWSWDPKETWALITFMVYAIAAHGRSFPSLQRPMNYHLFMVFAFLAILMTYFGVNYFLGGMHSYA